MKMVKNTLAAVGAVAIATTAPVFTIGVVIGATVVANSDKIEKAAVNFVEQVKEFSEQMSEVAKEATEDHSADEESTTL